MSDTQYFYADGSQQRGPHSAEEIIAMRLAPATLVWREGLANWQRLDSVPELNPSAAPMPGIAPQEPSAQIDPNVAAQGIPPQFDPSAVPPQNSPQPVPPYAQPIGYGVAPPRDDSKKVLAGIMGIIFGGLGVHKFILGYNQAGVIMLSVTLGCTFLGCCFGPLMLVPFGMSVIGLIEGIMYLAKSNEEFYHVYVLGRREWF